MVEAKLKNALVSSQQMQQGEEDYYIFTVYYLKGRRKKCVYFWET